MLLKIKVLKRIHLMNVTFNISTFIDEFKQDKRSNENSSNTNYLDILIGSLL